MEAVSAVGLEGVVVGGEEEALSTRNDFSNLAVGDAEAAAGALMAVVDDDDDVDDGGIESDASAK